MVVQAKTMSTYKMIENDTPKKTKKLNAHFEEAQKKLKLWALFSGKLYNLCGDTAVLFALLFFLRFIICL